MPDGEPKVPASLYRRPEWVMNLGRYGRASYEWRRRVDLGHLEMIDDPKTYFSMVNTEVTRRVEADLEVWANLADNEEMDLIPRAFADRDQELAARRAIELRPCLELVMLPRPEPVGPLLGGVSLDEATMALLNATSYESRLALADLDELGQDLQSHLTDPDLHPAEIDFVPTALLPTELVIVQSHVTTDLYQIYN